MMKLVISRQYDKNETKGYLIILTGTKCLFHCVTLELQDNGNQHNTSCIPEGVYQVEKYESEKHGHCFHIMNVPGRSDILIHIGNFASGVAHIDTKGCILPGMYFSDINNVEILDVAESTRAMKNLLEILPDKFEIHII
jgi:hypothetical protein